MKNIKKIGLGLATVLALAITIGGNRSAIAAAPNFNLRFANSGRTIVGSYAGNSFSFQYSGAPDYTYKLANTSRAICSGSVLNISQDVALSGHGGQASTISFSYRANGSGACIGLADGTQLPVAAQSGGPPPSAKINWTGAKGVLNSDGSLIKVTFSDKTTVTFEDNNITDQTYNFKPLDYGQSTIGGATIDHWCNNTLEESSGGDKVHGITLPALKPPSQKGSVNVCYNDGGADINQTASITVDTSAYTGTNGGSNSTAPSCENSSFTSFEWIICPALRVMDDVGNSFNNAVVGLLTFDVGKNLTPEVKSSWNIFKNIASAVLVIIMLIVVFAQAIGSGPLDAYTARKMLPRLVAAVIIMQLSWVILTWAIGIFNDLGVGVRDLISAPFGGYNNLNLDHLIAPLKLTGTLTSVGLFSILIGAVAFSGLTLGGLFLLAIAVIIGILIAFAVLMLRYIFIIMLVILSPFAIMLWILPGTERYWKMWYENFMKLMMLFPLIMALIYAGRIFAHVGAVTAGSSTTQAMLATLVVYIGYFAPYFFLPQALKWGGQMYGAMAGGIWNASKTARNFPARYAMQRAGENRQRREQLRAERLAENPESRRFTDRLLAGEFNFAKQRGRGGRLGAREAAFAQTLAEGEKAARENVPAQLLRSGYESWQHGPAVNERGERIREGEEGYVINKLDANQAWLEGRTYAGIAPSEALSGHAFDTLATLGDPDRIREAGQSGHVDPQVWTKAIARNFPKMNEIARYMTLAPDLSNLTAGQLITQDDDTAQELVRQLEGHYTHDRNTGGRIEVSLEDHRAQLERAATLAHDARANSQIWDNLSQAKREVLERAEALARAEGVEPRTRESSSIGNPRIIVPPGTRRPSGTEPTPPAPEPPRGPGPEENEGEIDLRPDR